MTRWTTLAFALVTTVAHAQAPGRDAPVTTEFRAFNGRDEVTSATRFRIFPAGSRDEAAAIESQRPLTPLAPGMYDVQVSRAERGVIAIKRVERLAIIHYPDEGGRHLEVINFRPGFGALQLRAARGRLEARRLALFTSGTRTIVDARPTAGDGYVLFVLPAGQYDVRLEHTQQSGGGDIHWLVGITVAADRTRLKLIDAGD